METRREKGRNASYYRHPIGDRINDIIVNHERERNDLVADLVQFQTTSSNIYALYGGSEEEYIKAMDKIYRRKGINAISVWDRDQLKCVDVFSPLTKTVKHALMFNFNKVVDHDELLTEWIPVFWYPNPHTPVNFSDFFDRVRSALNVASISSYYICMYSGRYSYETKVYMRRTFLLESEWGRQKINYFCCLTPKYIKEHCL